MVRRARRASQRQIAAYRASAEKSIASQVKKDIDRRIARGLQEFAVRSMNELAQLGPAWTGKFSASWGFAPDGVIPQTPGTKGRIYEYNKNNVPIRTVERYIRNGAFRFRIVNTAPHAGIAIDEVKASFFPKGKPIKERELGTGRDQPSLRYDIGAVFNGDPEQAGASRTADADWFPNYVLGGGLDKDLNAGFSFGFERGGQ